VEAARGISALNPALVEGRGNDAGIGGCRGDGGTARRWGRSAGGWGRT
jgi:hypothetical protein